VCGSIPYGFASSPRKGIEVHGKFSVAARVDLRARLFTGGTMWVLVVVFLNGPIMGFYTDDSGTPKVYATESACLVDLTEVSKQMKETKTSGLLGCRKVL